MVNRLFGGRQNPTHALRSDGVLVDLANGVEMARSVVFRLCRLAVLAGGLAGLGACAGLDAPRPPLMSPLSEAKDYGYAEKDAGKGRLEVLFVGPIRQVSVGGAARASQVALARTEAEELALLRAAQIAIARRAPEFRVVDRRSDINVEVQEHLAPFYHHHYRFRSYRRGRFFHPRYGYHPFHTIGFRNALAQAKAQLTVTFKGGTEGKAYDARKTASRLGPKYANRRPGQDG